MSGTDFRPARSMMDQIDELREEVDTQTRAASSALEHVAFLQKQYAMALDALSSANDEIFAWRFIAFWTACALIMLATFP
jgi:hypothetical protein